MRATPLFATLLLATACGVEHNLIQQPTGEETLEDTTVDDLVDPNPEPVAGEPIADAGPAQEVSPLDTVRLDGSASYDPEGLEITDMLWTPLAGPTGSTAVLSNENSARPEFFADLAGEYVFELSVMNEAGVWDSTPDPVTIVAVPLDGFYVELSWDNDNDLDLHMSESGSTLFSASDVSWCNDNPNWGANGGADNPSLDWDAVDGWGPETITIDSPADGSFDVRVHYYGEQGYADCTGPCASSEATVNIYLGGNLEATFKRTLDDVGQVWNVAQIKWPEYDVNEIDTVGSTSKSTCD